MRDPLAASPSPRALTGRVLLLFAVLMLLITLWTEYSVLVVDSTSFDSLAPAITALFMLALVALVLNPLLRLLAPGLALPGRQVAMLYGMIMTATPAAGLAFAHFGLPSTCSSFYFQSPENRWAAIFGQYRATWTCPHDDRVIREFWESGLSGVPWAAWWQPLLLWILYATAMFWVMACLNWIIRRQWIERERLTFPLVYLPLELARDEVDRRGRLRLVNSFARNPLTWIGFALAVIPHTFAGLHVYLPTVPDCNIKYIPLHQYFRGAPWDAVGTFQLSLYPCLIGFGYLLTREVGFSVWFFYLLDKAERIASKAVGWTGVGSGGLAAIPFEEHQGIGAWLVLIVYGLWIGRRYYRDVLRAAWGRAVSWIPPNEAGPYRLAVGGALAGLAVMCLFAVNLGMSLPVAVGFFGLYFVFVMALTRIRAEAGLGCISGPLTLQELLVSALGSGTLGPRNLTALQAFYWQTVEFRGAPTVMPCQLESLKIGAESDIPPAEMALGLMLAVVVTMLMATYVTMNVIYQHGGVTLNAFRFTEVPVTPYKRLASWLTSPTRPEWLPLGFVGLGGAFMALLTYMRIRHTWWPFHPVGFAVTVSKRTVHWTWFPVMVAWAVKSLILRYGGFRLYGRLLPLFLGLVLGDYFIGGVFGVVGALVPKPGYCVFP